MNPRLLDELEVVLKRLDTITDLDELVEVTGAIAAVGRKILLEYRPPVVLLGAAADMVQDHKDATGRWPDMQKMVDEGVLIPLKREGTFNLKIPSGDMCSKCGGFLVRTGTCQTCQFCGETTGCG